MKGSTSRMGARPRAPTRGIVLLLVVGILLVLSLIAIIFIQVVSVETHTSASALDSLRARNLAYSGIEKGMVDLRAWFLGPQPGKKRHVLGEEPSYAYSSEDHLDLPWGYGDPQERAQKYDPSEPLSTTLYPSLKEAEVRIEDPSGGQKNRTIGVSGVMSSKDGHTLNVFSLRILDTQSMIYINGPEEVQPQEVQPRDVFPSGGAPHPNPLPKRERETIANPRLFGISGGVRPLAPNGIKMLDSLALALHPRGFTVRDLGERISHLRLQLGRNILDREELKSVLGSTERERSKNLALLDGRVTPYAWVNPKTVFPGAFLWSSAGRGTTSGGTTSSSMDVALNPSVPLFQPRSPVDLNTAAPEVLFAVLNGLQGYAYNPQTQQVEKVALGESEARQLSADLSRERERMAKETYSGFTIFDELEHFLSTRFYLTPAQQALILANADPDLQLSLTNPDAVRRERWGSLDKTRLIYSEDPASCGYTTEFSFSSEGLYEISSLGRLLVYPKNIVPANRFASSSTRGGASTPSSGEPPAARVSAEAYVSVVVPIYQVLIQTTQEDFLRNAVERKNIAMYPSLESSPASSAGALAVSLTHPTYDFPLTFDYDQHQSLDAEFSLGPNLHQDSGVFFNPSFLNPSHWSSLTRDGFLAFPRTLSSTTPGDTNYLTYVSKGNLSSKEGTLTFWIKPGWSPDELPLDASQAKTLFTFGPLQIQAYHNRLALSKNPDFFQRYQDQAKVTPPPELAQKYTLVDQIAHDISSWNPGEWHYVVLPWSNEVLGTNVANPKIKIKVDPHCPESALIPIEELLQTFVQTPYTLATFSVDGAISNEAIFLPGQLAVPDHPESLFAFGSSNSNESAPESAGVTLTDIHLYQKNILVERLKQFLAPLLSRVKKTTQSSLIAGSDFYSLVQQVVDGLNAIAGSVFLPPNRYESEGTWRSQIRIPLEVAPPSPLWGKDEVQPQRVGDNPSPEGGTTSWGYVFALRWAWEIPWDWKGTVSVGSRREQVTLGTFTGPSFLGTRHRIHTGGDEGIPPAKRILVSPDNPVGYGFHFQSLQPDHVMDTPFVESVSALVYPLDSPWLYARE